MFLWPSVTAVFHVHKLSGSRFGALMLGLENKHRLCPKKFFRERMGVGGEKMMVQECHKQLALVKWTVGSFCPVSLKVLFC